jgi:hypothetical protein
VFSFWHWYNMENRYDGGNVKISTDGGATFTVVTPVGGYDDVATSGNAGIPGEPCFTDNVGVWKEAMFDLSAFTGQSITLRLHFGSDGSVNRPGWFVDLARLRSLNTDEVAPVISNVFVPPSTFDTAGPYGVAADVSDMFSGVDAVSLFYSTDDGTSWAEVAMALDTGDTYIGTIPGQASGTRVSVYLYARDVAGNETLEPVGAPADAYGFSILPSAPILVMVSSTTGATLAQFQEALETNGHAADYWNMSSQGTSILSYLHLYETVVLDERGSMSTSERAAYSAFLASGAVGAKKGFFVLGRDLGYYSLTRPWIQEWMRADYVQDDPAYREITGVAGDPIGAGETFDIDGSYPDETQRSTTYPGGEIVYQFTGTGGTALDRVDIEGAYEKAEKEWDGVMPHAPKSLDAAAGIRYNGDSYRSVYTTFNFDYVQEPETRATIIDRVVRWLDSPEIVHAPLADTEDTLSAYVATALIYSDALDLTRVKLHYDVGAGPVEVLLAPTGNPDEYAGAIPAQSFGTTVNYYLSAANTDGNTSYHPAGAPTDQHTFQVTADITPPEIVHTPMMRSADLAGPYTVEATVTDNVAVDPATVQMTWRKNGGATTTVTMTHVSGALYAADIPGPSVLGDLYEYFIIARDVAVVPNTARSPAAGYHALEIVDFYVWDFEADDGGFAAAGPDWEWGEPTSGPGGGHSGTKVWATKLGGNYSASSNSTLDLPALNVPSGSTFAQLSLWHWYNMETNYDGGNIKISTDGGATWTILTPDVGYDGTASSFNAGIPGEPCFTGTHTSWNPVVFDLTPYKGVSVVIRLHFGSDSSVQRVGWYVDDVTVEGIEDTVGPEFASVDVPTSTFDETGPYPVTATVLDALSGVASAMLHYSTDDGVSYTAVAMTPTGNPDEYGGDIPGQSAGTRIKHYLSAVDNAANASVDPAGAPATTYEFGIMPSGDYLVLLGGGSHTSPVDFQAAFSAIGRTADIWDWDDLGMPTIAILEAYDAVVIDESWYFDTTQKDTLSAWLDRADGTMQRVFMLGRDLSYGTSARPFMEQYTGSIYVKDDPGFRELTSTPGNPIGNDETFTIVGSYPDELALSTVYTGAQIVYKYSGTGSAIEIYDSAEELREFYEKSGKPWDPRIWPLDPSGPDSAAAVSFVGPNHAAVYMSFNLNYVQEASRRAGILDRSLDWLGAAAFSVAANRTPPVDSPKVPDLFVLGQNYPNPFNPVTRIQFGIPAGYVGTVSLKVFNVRGQLVATLFEGTRPPGYYTFDWNGTNRRGESVATGIYFARFQSERTTMIRKMVLLK